MKNPLGKRLQIKDANSKMFIVIAVSAVLAVFALMSAKFLIGEIAYTTRVLSAKDKAAAQLDENLSNAEKLKAEYKVFAESAVNVLGGSATGGGPLDGPNDRIALDSLPSKYDFPGLVSSLEKIVKTRALQLQNINGTDDEINNNSTEPTADPEPITMAFALDASGNYQQVKDVIADFQRSIRPFQISKLTISGSNNNMLLSLQAETYFQPTKSIVIEKEEIK